MALSEDDVAALDQRARDIGAQISRDLRFVVAPNPEFVGLTSLNIFVLGPSSLRALAAHDIDLTLDQIERGERNIVDDEDGDPRLV